MIPVAQYTNSAEMLAAYQARRRKLYPTSPKPKLVLVKSEPEPQPETTPPGRNRRSPLWEKLAESQKRALVVKHWHDGASFRTLAKAISEDIGASLTRGAIRALFARNGGEIDGHRVNAPTPAQVVEFEGRRMTLRELSAIHGVPVKTIRQRINRLGWSVAEAASVPAGSSKWRYRGSRSTPSE